MRLILAIIAPLALTLAARSATISVTPDGAVKTLEAAIKEAARIRSSGNNEPVRIELAPGRYELEAPIIVTPELAGNGLEVVGPSGSRPVVSGGRRITGWKRDTRNPNLWTAEIPEAREGKWEFRQLFINGRRATRARQPNAGAFYRINGESPQDKPARIKFKPGEIKPEWAAAGDVELIAYLAWADIRMQIRKVDADQGVATLSGDPRPSNKENNAQYYLENAEEFLDAPGEWWLDKKTGRVSCLAHAGEDLERAEVIAPRLQELVVLKGDFEKKVPVRNVVFRNIVFSHTDYLLPETGYADTQAAIATRGEFRAEAAEDCAVENCVFSHLAGYAVDLGRGCKRFKVIGNEMEDLGAGGVRIGEPQRPGGAFEENHSHEVTDNHIHAGGRIYPPAVGVFILQSGTNRIAHNHIHDLYYTAVSVGWNWGYQETPCRENIIEYNHLHDIGQGLLSDMGAVYTLGIQHGTVIRNNLIHDVNAFTYGGWGLYTDEGSTGILLENNVVYRCKNAGFHQHYGKENVIRNNIFALNKENQIMRTRPEEHISFFLTNNIVYFDSGNLLGSNWSNDHYVIDQNIYFDARLGTEQERMKFAGGSLEEWRKRGHDTNSLLADPLFENPGQGNFHLKPNSPALARGFKPIDLSTVGVRPREKRN